MGSDLMLLALGCVGLTVVALALVLITKPSRDSKRRAAAAVPANAGHVAAAAAAAAGGAEQGADAPALNKRQQLKDAKRRAKEEARLAREAAREAAEQARSERSSRADAYAEKMRRSAAEGERRGAEEDKQRHQAELERLQQARERALALHKDEQLMQRIVEYVEQNKVVVLEELASVFQLAYAEVVRRIEELERQSRITGVVDDSGRFLFVNPVEMLSMADYIRSRGRVGVSELASECGRVIQLEGHDAPAAAVPGEA